MNYTDVFGAQTVPPSEESYIFHNLSGADNQLYWPEQYSGAGYLLADITELTGAGVVAVRLPAADAVSVGESFLLRNRCLDDIQVNDASGAPAALLPAGQTLFFYVVDNTTPEGQWQIFTFGAGTSAADAVALAGDGLSVATGRLRVSSEYRAINSDYPIVPEDRGQILDVVTGTVTVTTPDATTAGDGFYCFIRNSSAGNLTLEGRDTQTVNGALSVPFAPGDSVILMSTGTNWVTVGYGRSVSGQFSEVIVNAAAGDVTLSSSDVAGRMIRVAGTATTNITVTLPAIDNIYFVVVEAGMGAYNVTFTTGSGATTILTASQRTVLTSDGTNVLAAVTTTVTSSLALVDGSAAAPSISFSLDTNTGIYRKTNDTIGFTTGGTERMALSPTGLTLQTALAVAQGGTGATTAVNALANLGATTNTRNIIAGNGLTGGGDLTADRTLTLGTPSTLTTATANAVTATSHTHAITFPVASDTVSGIIELATDAEVQAGVDAVRAVTPAGLASCTATETRTGVVELATKAEAVVGTDTTRAVTAAGVAAAILSAFPVGSVYITASNINPATFLGGTWSQIAQGRTLIGVGTLSDDTYAAGATGGAARVTLTTAEMPSHNHGGATGTQSADHTHSFSGSTSTIGNHHHTIDDSNSEGSSYGLWAYGNRGGANNNPGLNRTNDAGSHNHTVSGTTGSNSASHTHSVSFQGGGGAHENRMPYLAVYFWQRTA